MQIIVKNTLQGRGLVAAFENAGYEAKLMYIGNTKFVEVSTRVRVGLEEETTVWPIQHKNIDSYQASKDAPASVLAVVTGEYVSPSTPGYKFTVELL